MNKLEKASSFNRPEIMRVGYALLFLVGIVVYISSEVGNVPGNFLLICAAMVGGYMAMNIGANDVANNVGPAVGSKALSLVGAIIIAAIFENNHLTEVLITLLTWFPGILPSIIRLTHGKPMMVK